ncbi:MAG TPA: cache domain-containing protein [Nitrososphaeraceae archaeon]|nr:cache domain-containing protein [Nitrososphaeraceae archaeon]
MAYRKQINLNTGTFVIIGLFSCLLTILPAHTLMSSSDNLNRTETYRMVNATDRNNILALQILANSLQDRLGDAAAIMEITGNLSEIRSMPNSSLLNATLEIFHGIPPDSDLQKRRIAQNIVSNYPDIAGIAFIMPNGDTYFLEPGSLQRNQTKNNLAYRDYFKGAIATNDTYLGDIITSTASGLKRAVIAVPVYSQTGEGDLTGIWVGSLDLNILNKELQSLNLTEGERIVYIDSNDTKIADSDKRLSTNSSESFSGLKSFQKAIDGEFGSIVEKVNLEKKLVSYYPVEAIQNRWVILWMHPVGMAQDEPS